MIEKDFLISFFIALIVALLFYYISLDGAGSRVDIYFIHTDGSLDLYLIEFGMIMPFILPLFFLFKIIKSRPRGVKYGR